MVEDNVYECAEEEGRSRDMAHLREVLRRLSGGENVDRARRFIEGELESTTLQR